MKKTNVSRLRIIPVKVINTPVIPGSYTPELHVQNHSYTNIILTRVKQPIYRIRRFDFRLKGRRIAGVFALFNLLIAAILFSGCDTPAGKESIDIGQALSSSTALPCFKRADRELPLVFPADHGPHDDFQTEWWYYTGNLADPSGRRFGYQLTFFRRALACAPIIGASPWRTRQLYFAHFAVTDIEAATFHSDHRMDRESIGIAGATPHRVWIENWSVKETGDHKTHLTARGADFSVDFILSPGKPPVMQGKSGLSQKSTQPGNASYYYSLPRSPTQGTILTPAGEFTVSGRTWFDHEWSTSALDSNEKGWDWFALQLDDGKDIMVCQIRRADNRPNGFSFGSISHADGRYDILGPEDFTLTSTGTWQSPATQGIYPSGWKIFISPLNLELKVTPRIKAQEHTGDFIYWEGAVAVSGKQISGDGYVELTGYLKE